MLCGMLEMKTAAKKLRLIGKAVPIWIPKMIDSGTPSTTEPTTMPIAPPTPAWPKRVSTILSATRKTATPTSIHSANCQRESTSSASATRSKEIAAIRDPAPKPARNPRRGREHRPSRRTHRPAARTTPRADPVRMPQAPFSAASTASTSSARPCTGVTRTCAPARNLRARVSLPDLTQDPDLAGRGEPLDHFAGLADEILDPCLNLLAPHAALPVPDLEDKEHAAHEPADDVPRRGQEDEEQQSE